MDYEHKSAIEAELIDRSDFGFRYVDNTLVRDAFALEELGTADLKDIDLVGKIVIRIGDFRVRKPPRNVRLYRADFENPHEQPWNTGPQHGQPGSPPPGSRRTRWDIDVSNLLLPAGGRRKRVEIYVVLAIGLSFWEPDGLRAITAKSKPAAKRLVNLEVPFRNDKGWPTARFNALGPRNAANPVVEDGFNIAMVAGDEDDHAFSLPMIIDPPFRNRAT